MVVNEQKVIRRDSRVKCLKRDAEDTEIEGTVSRVHDDAQHVDVCYGPLWMLSRSYVPIKFIEVLS